MKINKIITLFLLGTIGILAPLFAAPPLPGLERLFVVADIPAHVQFHPVQNYVKRMVDPHLNSGAFHRTDAHTTFLYIGDIPHAQVPQVIHAVNTGIDIFQQHYGTQGLKGFYVLPGGRILGTNAVVMRLFAPQEAYALTDILDRQVSAVTGKHSLGYMPHVTLGRLPKVDAQAPILGTVLPTLVPTRGARGPAETFSIARLRLSSTVGKGYNTLVTYDLQKRKVPAARIPLKRPATAAVAAFSKAKQAVKAVAQKVQRAKPVAKHAQKRGAVRAQAAGKRKPQAKARRKPVLKKRSAAKQKKGYKKPYKKAMNKRF